MSETFTVGAEVSPGNTEPLPLFDFVVDPVEILPTLFAAVISGEGNGGGTEYWSAMILAIESNWTKGSSPEAVAMLGRLLTIITKEA